MEAEQTTTARKYVTAGPESRALENGVPRKCARSASALFHFPAHLAIGQSARVAGSRREKRRWWQERFLLMAVFIVGSDFKIVLSR